jgi:NitT/TauT family transport system substrate-binding protein
MNERPRSAAQKKVRLIGVLVVAALAAGGIWWASGHESGRSAGTLEPVTLAASLVYPGSGLILIAQDKGYFKAEGLDVTIQPHGTGKDSLDASLGGKADFATTADLPIVLAALKGAPVVVAATMSTSDRGYGMVARKDKGVAGPADVKGKRIGVTMGSSGQFWLDTFLMHQHLGAGDVRLTHIAAEKLADALTAGEVDAVATWDPYLGEANEALRGKGVLFSSDGFYDSPWNLVTRRDVAEHRPETVRKMLRALIRAERFYDSDPNAALALIARVQETEPARLRAVLEKFKFSVRLSQSLLGTLEDETRWVIRNKLTAGSKVPNFLDHVYLDGLLAVNPDAVSVIR